MAFVNFESVFHHPLWINTDYIVSVEATTLVGKSSPTTRMVVAHGGKGQITTYAYYEKTGNYVNEIMRLIKNEDPSLLPDSVKLAQDAQSAFRTLEHLGYTNHGGEYWKPPISKALAPLTDEQVHLGQWDDGSGSSADFREGVRFAERKHGIHAKGGQHG